MADLTPHHRLTLKSNSPLKLQVTCELSVPWTILFGPSGSGKTSILRALSGLHPAASQTTFDRREQDAWLPLATVPTHLRRLAYAPQQSSLFPHLTVAQNISFPHQVTRQTPPVKSLLEEVTHLFHLEPLIDRLPRHLSGGERQRVSLARAFATPNPALMLLDEPFSGMDRSLRDTLLPRMQQHLAERSIPALTVTHDIEEALLLNAEVIRIESGNVLAQGPATEVLAVECANILETLRKP